MSDKGSFRIVIVTALVVFGFVFGSALREFTPYTEAGIGAAFGLPAIFALFGMFWIAENWKDAITAAFAVTYFIFLAGVLSLSVFSGDGLALDSGSEAVLNSFAGLVSVVLLGYFGQEAVRAGAEAYRQTHMDPHDSRIRPRDPIVDTNAHRPDER